MPLTRAMAVALEENDPQASSSRKRARTANQPIQRTDGRATRSLKRIFDLPLEIFNEIASHLTPAELLFLARSSKFFRKMFMSRSSINTWRSAFGNVPGLPPCPPELCEPQYASLLFSKSCSECGARVHRRMDAHLLAKLCNFCRDEIVDEFEDDFEMRRILPFSDQIIPSRPGYIFLLKRDTQEFLRVVRPILDEKGTGLLDWFDSQRIYIRERKIFAAEVEGYLDSVEEERARQLLSLKNKRREEIEKRLLEGGWSKKDMDFPSETRNAWLEHVFQPRLLTDRIWDNIYPKLVRLLKANKAYHEELDRKMRMNGRRGALTSMVLDIEETLPPMVRVTLHAHTQGHSIMSGSADTVTWTEDKTLAIGFPLPAPREMWALRVAQELIEPDVPIEEMESAMEARREEIKQEIVDWGNGFLQRATDAWFKGQNQPINQLVDETGPSTSNIKPAKQAGTRRSTRLKVRASSKGGSHLGPLGPTLPICTVEFSTNDNKTTTNIAELPRNLQILLRADTVFTSKGSPLFYPTILPDTIFSVDEGATRGFSQSNAFILGDVERDDKASAVARALLRHLGRPDATHAEMWILGKAFSCQRCLEGIPSTWKDIVKHFTEEQDHWTQAQPKLCAFPPGPKPVFHNTHDLAHPLLCVKVLAPAAASDLKDLIMARGAWPTDCKICHSLGVEAQYSHHVSPPLRSNIVAHLMRAHDIQEPVEGVDFRTAGSDWSSSDSDDSDEE